MTAPESKLNSLHAALADLLLDILENGVPVSWDEEGNETARRKASAAEMNVVVSFLDKNKITVNINEDLATKQLQEALVARRRRVKPIMPDFLADEITSMGTVQ